MEDIISLFLFVLFVIVNLAKNQKSKAANSTGLEPNTTAGDIKRLYKEINQKSLASGNIHHKTPTIASARSRLPSGMRPSAARKVSASYRLPAASKKYSYTKRAPLVLGAGTGASTGIGAGAGAGKGLGAGVGTGKSLGAGKGTGRKINTAEALWPKEQAAAQQLNAILSKNDIIKAFVMSEVLQRYDLNRIYSRIPNFSTDDRQ